MAADSNASLAWAPPLVIDGDEQQHLAPDLPDGGLPPAVGVHSVQVFRATRDAPDLADGRGWTYHHHVDLAAWRGRLYVGWNSCEKDEDTWPSIELFSTSRDGDTWTPPQELFPSGVSTPLRMYFFLAPNGRMLAIAGLRTSREDTSEEHKRGLVVREIRSDHTLGDVFVLQRDDASPASLPAQPFDESRDAGFVEACRQLLADTVFLEQQDLGRLLGSRRMRWHDAAAWPEGKVPGDSDKWRCGKAWSFLRRDDGVLLAISKMGWTSTSDDAGRSWQQPAVPPTLVTGKAKVWAQKTSDGRFALVYNPSRGHRYPLAVVHGDDGVHFRDLRIVQGELPPQRYLGKFRSVGPQYTRGLSTWSDDGSFDHTRSLWVVYSMSKEDIWVSRVPLPVRVASDERTVIETLAGTLDCSAWNIHRPRWAEWAVQDRSLSLVNRDPYDDLVLTRVVSPRREMTVEFDLRFDPSPRGDLLIELLSTFGSRRAVSAAIPATLGGRVKLSADVSRQVFSLSIGGTAIAHDAGFAQPAEDLQRLSLRVRQNPQRPTKGPIEPGTDRPGEPIALQIADLRIA